MENLSQLQELLSQTDRLKLRVLQCKPYIGDPLEAVTQEQPEYNSPKAIIRIRDVWYLRVADEPITEVLEKIAERKRALAVA